MAFWIRVLGFGLVCRLLQVCYIFGCTSVFIFCVPKLFTSINVYSLQLPQQESEIRQSRFSLTWWWTRTSLNCYVQRSPKKRCCWCDRWYNVTLVPHNRPNGCQKLSPCASGHVLPDHGNRGVCIKGGMIKMIKQKGLYGKYDSVPRVSGHVARSWSIAPPYHPPPDEKAARNRLSYGRSYRF
jgi:hypothetical protein